MDGNTPMEFQRGIQINWGTFNIPTLISVFTVFFYMATGNERQNARLDAIESDRSRVMAEYSANQTAVQAKLSMIDNIQYRTTVLEQGIADVNRRIDRQTDSMQDIRDDIGQLSANFQVLTQKIETALAPKQTRANGVPPRD